MEGEGEQKTGATPISHFYFAPNVVFSCELVFDGETKYFVKHVVL